MVEDKRRVRKIAANRARIYIGRQCAFVVVPDNAQKNSSRTNRATQRLAGTAHLGFSFILRGQGSW